MVANVSAPGEDQRHHKDRSSPEASNLRPDLAKGDRADVNLVNSEGVNLEDGGHGPAVVNVCVVATFEIVRRSVCKIGDACAVVPVEFGISS